MTNKAGLGIGGLAIIALLALLFWPKKSSGGAGSGGGTTPENGGNGGGTGIVYPITLTVSGSTVTRTTSTAVLKPIWVIVNSAGQQVLKRNAFNLTTGVQELSLNLASLPVTMFPAGTYTVWVAESGVAQVSNAVNVTVVR